MGSPTHVVLRVVPSSEGDVLAGTHVDASAWANRRLLESSGHIRPLGPGELGDQIPDGEPERAEQPRKAAKGKK